MSNWKGISEGFEICGLRGLGLGQGVWSLEAKVWGLMFLAF